MTLTPRHDFTPLEIDWVEDRLYEFNVAATGHADGLGLGFVIHDAAGDVAGMAAGYSWGGVSELKQMWVREDLRGSGQGSALLTAFIDEARARGCELLWVMTYDFQAPAFYQRHGFEPVAELGPWPKGHVQHFLRLTL
jgi:GNAT superfamily N-acetyltransferase